MNGRKIMSTVLLMILLLAVGTFCISEAAEYKKIPILMVHG